MLLKLKVSPKVENIQSHNKPKEDVISRIEWKNSHLIRYYQERKTKSFSLHFYILVLNHS